MTCGNTQFFEYASGEPFVLVVTHASLVHSLRAKLEVLQAEMQIAFPGELYAVDTVSDVLFKCKGPLPSRALYLSLTPTII